MVPVLIINLERDAARRDALTARLDALNVPYRIHKAMAGKDLPPDYLERHSPRRELAFGRALMPNEVATGLSHVAAVREGLGLGTEFFCVLEDDTIPAPRFAECLDEATLKALPEFDALRLFAHFDRWEKPSKTVATLAGSVVVRMLRPGWGCAGQIYTRAGAEKIVSSMRFISAPIDFAIYHDCHVMGLKVLETRPSPSSRMPRCRARSGTATRSLSLRFGAPCATSGACVARFARRGAFCRPGGCGSFSPSSRRGIKRRQPSTMP